MNDWLINFFMFFGAMCFFHFVLEVVRTFITEHDFSMSLSNLVIYFVISLIAGTLRYRKLRGQIKA